MIRRTHTSRRTRDAGWHIDGRLEPSEGWSQSERPRGKATRSREHTSKEELLAAPAKPTQSSFALLARLQVSQDNCPPDVRL